MFPRLNSRFVSGCGCAATDEYGSLTGERVGPLMEETGPRAVRVNVWRPFPLAGWEVSRKAAMPSAVPLAALERRLVDGAGSGEARRMGSLVSRGAVERDDEAEDMEALREGFCRSDGACGVWNAAGSSCMFMAQTVYAKTSIAGGAALHARKRGAGQQQCGRGIGQAFVRSAGCVMGGEQRRFLGFWGSSEKTEVSSAMLPTARWQSN